MSETSNKKKLIAALISITALVLLLAAMFILMGCSAQSTQKEEAESFQKQQEQQTEELKAESEKAAAEMSATKANAESSLQSAPTPATTTAKGKDEPSADSDPAREETEDESTEPESSEPVNESSQVEDSQSSSRPQSTETESSVASESTGTTACNHNYVPVYRTETTYERVHHDAVTEEQYIIDEEAWDEEVWAYRDVCWCGFDFTAAGYTNDQIGEHAKAHALAGESDQSWGENYLVETIHHEEVGHYETVTIEEAYDEVIDHEEQILDHYECSKCGATKAAD